MDINRHTKYRKSKIERELNTFFDDSTDDISNPRIKLPQKSVILPKCMLMKQISSRTRNTEKIL